MLYSRIAGFLNSGRNSPWTIITSSSWAGKNAGNVAVQRKQRLKKNYTCRNASRNSQMTWIRFFYKIRVRVPTQLPRWKFGPFFGDIPNIGAYYSSRFCRRRPNSLELAARQSAWPSCWTWQISPRPEDIPLYLILWFIHSALEVFHIMRYTNLRLLTYLPFWESENNFDKEKRENVHILICMSIMTFAEVSSTTAHHFHNCFIVAQQVITGQIHFFQHYCNQRTFYSWPT